MTNSQTVSILKSVLWFVLGALDGALLTASIILAALMPHSAWPAGIVGAIGVVPLVAAIWFSATCGWA